MWAIHAVLWATHNNMYVFSSPVNKWCNSGSSGNSSGSSGSSSSRSRNSIRRVTPMTEQSSSQSVSQSVYSCVQLCYLQMASAMFIQILKGTMLLTFSIPLVSTNRMGRVETARALILHLIMCCKIKFTLSAQAG